MNFVFGLTTLPRDSDGNYLFDIQNNPYVEYMGYEIFSSEQPEIMFRLTYEYENCPDEIMERFVERHTYSWWDQPLCHKNRDNVTVKNNWFFDEYSFPSLALVYCKNTTANNQWCKPYDEIDQFLREHPTFFVHQETRVQNDIFEDHEIVDQYPYFGDKENYYPTLKSMTSYNYGPIDP